ncbi:hypothetical protein V6Z11_D12G036500, partial [Gossypium hirsutum]
LFLSFEFDNDTLRTLKLEALEERKHKAKKNLSVYQRRLSRAYEKLVKMRNFEEGEVMLQGLYIFHEFNKKEFCKLLNPKNTVITMLINFQYIKKYHV